MNLTKTEFKEKTNALIDFSKNKELYKTYLLQNPNDTIPDFHYKRASESAEKEFKKQEEIDLYLHWNPEKTIEDAHKEYALKNNEKNAENTFENISHKIITPNFNQLKKIIQKLIYYSSKDVTMFEKSNSNTSFKDLNVSFEEFNKNGGDFNDFKNNVLIHVFDFHLIENIINKPSNKNINTFKHKFCNKIKESFVFGGGDRNLYESDRIVELTKNIIEFLIADSINKFSENIEFSNKNLSLFDELIKTRIEENNFLMRNPVYLYMNNQELIFSWVVKVLNNRKYKSCCGNIDLHLFEEECSREFKKYIENIKMEANIDGWKLDLLTPIEAERLQGFDDDWTNCGMNDRMRFFCMGNALVVPMITRMGNVLDGIIAEEK